MTLSQLVTHRKLWLFNLCLLHTSISWIIPLVHTSLLKTSLSSEPKPNTTTRARVGGDDVESKKWRRSNGIKETCEACRHTLHQGFFSVFFFWCKCDTYQTWQERRKVRESLSWALGRFVLQFLTYLLDRFTFQMYNYVLGKGIHTKAITI